MKIVLKNPLKLVGRAHLWEQVDGGLVLEVFSAEPLACRIGLAQLFEERWGGLDHDRAAVQTS
ncbi:MAG: hypothetical protein AAGB51_04885 [Planctomycetota bacterium]